MARQRVTVKLTELRCLVQSESGSGSEPYLWTTFFAFGAEQSSPQSGVFAIITHTYNEFRTEFPDGMKAGSVAQVPVFIASGAFDFDLDGAPQPKLVGAIAVLMEEDSTPQQFMVQGLIAYAKEIEVQLQALGRTRILADNTGPLTEAESEAIKKAVTDKVKSAVAHGQNIGGFFRDQDDNLGFAFKMFTHHRDDAANSQIKTQSFNFPRIDTLTKVPVVVPGSTQAVRPLTDRFVLSGTMTVGPVPKPPVIRCPAERAALQAKRDEVSGLHTRLVLLQKELQTAAPQAKPVLIQSIEQVHSEIAAAEAALPALQVALEACLLKSGPKTGTGPDIGPVFA